MNEYWKHEIQELVVARKHEIDGINGHKGPASELELARVEALFGAPLNVQYRDFLRQSDGWENLVTGASLFGTADLLGNTGLMRRAQDDLAAFVESNSEGRFPPDEASPDDGSGVAPPLESIRLVDVRPIGYCTWYLSIIVIGNEGSPCAGQVLHLLGSGINRYPDFRSFIRYVISLGPDSIQ